MSVEDFLSGGSSIDEFLGPPPEGAFRRAGRILTDPEGGVGAALGSLIDRALPQGGPNQGWLGDTAIDLARAPISSSQTLAGLANLASAGQAGKLLDALGYNPKEAQDFLSQRYSPTRKAQQQEVSNASKAAEDELTNASGAWDTTKAAASGAGRILGSMLLNPGTIQEQVIQSAPDMLMGAGVVGKAAKGIAAKGGAEALDAAANKLSWLGHGIEGAQSAGQNAEQIRESSPDNLAGQYLQVPAGILTGLIGRGAAKVPGFGDVQTAAQLALAGPKGASKALAGTGGVTARLLKAGFSEGFLQELPQSYQEQIWQNLAEGKPWNEGALTQGVQGAMTGFAMGLGEGSISGKHAKPASVPAATPDAAGADQANAALGAAVDQYAGIPSVPQLGHNPLAPDGSVIAMPAPGSLADAAATAHATGATPAPVAPSLLVAYPNLQSAKTALAARPDADLMTIIPHPEDKTEFALVPKTQGEIDTIQTQQRAQQAAQTRQEQLASEEEASQQDASTRKTILQLYREAGAVEKTIGDTTPPAAAKAARAHAADLRAQAVELAKGIREKALALSNAVRTQKAETSAASVESRGRQVFQLIGQAKQAAAAGDTATESRLMAQARELYARVQADHATRTQQLANEAAQSELAPAPVQPVAAMPGVQQANREKAAAATVAAQTRQEQLASEEQDSVDAAASAANTTPTEGQKKAGNYLKGHIRVAGLDISTENPAGSVRQGTNAAGKTWKVKMSAHYGYLRRTTGADGGQVDIYVKPGTTESHTGPVFVVDQYDPATGRFDEHKTLIGYGSQAEAAKAYDAHFADKTGPKRRGAVTPMTVEAFKAWLRNGDTTRPVSATKFGGEISDTAQAAQEEIARSTGAKFSLPRLARLPGETDAAYLQRRAAQANAARAGRVEQRKLPTREGDEAVVRETLDLPVGRGIVVSADTRPDAGKTEGVSKQAARFIAHVAKLFDQRVVFFDVPLRSAAEGFYTRGNTIYLNVNSSTQHLRVLGHELTHAMKRQAGEAYQQMLDAVAALRTDEEMAAQFKDYFGKELEDPALLDQPHPGSNGTLREFLAEEWMADLSGNRFAEEGFWMRLFTTLEQQHGGAVAKGIIARVRLALVAALNKLKSLISGNGFAVDARMEQHLEDIRKAVTAGFAEYARLSKAGQLSEVAGTTKFSGELDLPEGYALQEGTKGLARGKVRVLDAAGEAVGNWMDTPQAAIADARKNQRTRDAFATKQGQKEEDYRRIRDAVLAEKDLTDADLAGIGLKPGQSRFDYLSPVIQRLLGIPARQVREAIGTALRQGQGQFGGAAEYANPRTAIANAVGWLQKAKLSPERANPARLFFKVAPDPRNTVLKAAWDQLTPKDQTAISLTLSQRIIPKVLSALGAKGHMEAQLGGWMDDTSPSFAMVLEQGDAGEVAKAIGHVLSQEAMYVMSLKPFTGGVKGRIITIDVGVDASPAEIHAVYQKVRALSPETISGHSTIHGVMHIGVPLEGSATLGFRTNALLRNQYTVQSGEGYSAEIQEKDYGYAIQQRNPSPQRLAEWGIIDSAKTEAEQLFRSELADRGVKFSPGRHDTRSDAAGDRRDRGVGQGTLRREVQPESVSAVGIHYTKQQRERLDSSYFGTGIRGAEVERVQAATDSRIKQRIYFYVNSGRPIKPEEGVGSHAHQAQLDNLYDGDNDPLDLRVTNTFSGFESAVLDKGFDGYITHERGIAVLLGKRNIPVEYLGQNDRPEVPPAEKAEPSEYGKQPRAVAANRALPAGEMTGADWKRLIPRLMPDIDVSHLDDGQKYYKNEIVQRPEQAKLSPPREDGLPESTPTARTLDGAELKALRRAAAGLERPQDGVFLQVTEDGRAIATGPKGVHIPDTFRRFAHDHGLTFYAGRELPDYSQKPAGDMNERTDKTQFSPPRFYSQLARAVENAPAKLQTQPAAQWRLWLANQQSIKKDELNWSGVLDWLTLQGKAKVSREQIQEYLAHNGVRVEDVVLGLKDFTPEPLLTESDIKAKLQGVYWEVSDPSGKTFEVGTGVVDSEAEAVAYGVRYFNSHIRERNREAKRGQDTSRYGKYKLPGGENYRELLITLPDTLSDKLAERKELARMDRERPLTAAEQARYSHLQEETRGAKATFQSDHFDQPNLLAHIRTTDRTDAEGNKVLFLEEIQSDWGQKGRDKGFKSTEPIDTTGWSVVTEKDNSQYYGTRDVRIFDAAGALLVVRGGVRSSLTDADLIAETARNKDVLDNRDKVSAGPFVQDTKAWTALALKRAVLWAVQHGYAKVAWTNGEQQADRYGLSKHVGYLSLDRTFAGYHVTAYRNEDATDAVHESTVKTLQEVADLVGKDAADKLVKDMGEGTHGELRRPDIKVGGEGMRAFYDQIVPSVANDLLRKVGGGKVETVKVDLGDYGKTGRTAEKAKYAEFSGQMGFTITPEMAARVTDEGLPLFSPQRLSEEFETSLQTHFKAKQPGPVKLSDNTPAALRLFGWKDLPMVVDPNVIDKMHFDHGMTVPQMAKLPFLLKRPLMIFADNANKSLVFVGEHLAPGKIALVAIKPETRTMFGTDKVLSNMVVTGYAPQNGWSEVAKRVMRGELVYRDTTGALPEVIRGALAAAQKKYAQFGRGLPRELLQGSASRTYGDSSEKAQSGTRSPTVSAARSVLERPYTVLEQSDLVKHETAIWPEGAKFSRVRKVGETTVIENPTRQQARVLLTRSEYEELRGLQDPETGKLWIWDASRLLHEQAARGLGLSGDDFDRLKTQTDGHGHGLLHIKYLDEGSYPYPIFSGERKTGVLFSLNRPTLGALTPAQEAAAEHVLGTPKTFWQRLQDFKQDWAKNLKQGIFDQFAPIAELDPKAYIQARLSKGGESTLEALMLYGKVFVGADGGTDVRYTRAGGLQGFAPKMAALKGEHDRFFLWVAAQRAERLKGIGLENLFSAADIAELKTLNQGAMKDGTARGPLYRQALQDLNEFNDNVLKVAVDSGLIDEATRQMYKDTPYVPFYRLQEEGDVSGFGITPGLVNQYAWKKLKGGTDKLNQDLLANMLHNWSHLITASAKNRAARATLDAAVTAGVAIDRTNDVTAFDTNGKAIYRGSEKGLVSYKGDVVRRIPKGQSYTENGAAKVSDGTATVLYHGDRYFLISDPHLMDAVAALHYAGLGPWAKPLSAMKHWLTIGVTANPAFKLRNLIRDSIQSISSADMSYNVRGNVLQGWKATAQDSETRARLLASGGMIRFGSMLDGKDSQRAQDLINSGVAPDMILDSDSKIKNFWKRYMHPALEAYNELGDRSEQINRAALYEQLVAKGLTHTEAAYWARDLMDFSMSGKWTAIRTLTQTVPFFNARLQGLYKLGRAGKQNIRRLGTVLGATALASLALLLWQKDEDWWKRLNYSERNNYWWIGVGGHVFKLPKPFEIGAIATLAERGLELMISDEMTGKRFGKNMSDIVMNQLSMNPTPQLFKPLMDIYANKDDFTGRDIESMADQKLRKQDRYDEKTTELARFLGGLGLPDPTQLAMGRWDTLSPKQFDFLARGYFSWLATMTTTAIDYGIRPMLDRGARPDLQLKDIFFIGNFAEALPSNSSRYLQQMYDQAREIEQAYQSYHHMLKLGNVEAAKGIFADEQANIIRYQPTEAMKRAESFLNARLQHISADKELSGEEKRLRLDQIYARKNQLAQAFRAQ